MQNVVVAVLRILDKKYHQERDDGRRRVNDELPCVVVMEVRPCDPPDAYQNDSQKKGF
jgi:hypothetical protein